VEAVSKPPIGFSEPFGKFCVDIFSNNNNKYYLPEYQFVKFDGFAKSLL
jgi:hypothetical protein